MKNKTSAKSSAANAALIRLGALALAAALSACGGGGGSGAAASSAATETLSPAAMLGDKIFADVSLSASGKQSCATCHDPAFAHAQNNDLPVQFGGPNGDVQGFRAAPSLRYRNEVPAFAFDKEGTPIGGLTRDGRATSLAAQAAVPFVAPHEMANSPAAIVAAVKAGAYGAQFKQVFGAAVFDDVEQAFARVTFAVQQYQLEDPKFHPFDSKYDLFLAGKATLSEAELRGLALFNRPDKGNCAACHTSSRRADGAPPLFTDFSFDNLGVPRNAAIKATADPSYFDMGLCGPDRLDLAGRTDLCGAFQVPTLRNVATRKVFFHNGSFSQLSEVVRFYVQRDTNPGDWYPLVGGVVEKYNDLPAAYRGNVNTSEAPYNRRLGEQPALSSAEIADVVAFMRTLTDADLSNP